MSLKSVKTKIKSIDKTRQVTKAMEAVSAVKMRKSQASALGVRPYATSALKILKGVSTSIDATKHPLARVRPVRRTLVVVVSADKGLAGSFGSALFKKVYRAFADAHLNEANTDLICIGKKALEHFTKRNWNVIHHALRWSDGVQFSEVEQLAAIIKKHYEEEKVDRVCIIYTNFISTLNQEVVVRQLLPVTKEGVEEVVRGIVPEKGKFSELRADEKTSGANYHFESDSGDILDELIPALFNIQIYHSALESCASEHSARMIAMKNASDNAKEISRTLKLHFNKVRQASITREVSEIVGGMESMRTVDA